MQDLEDRGFPVALDTADIDDMVATLAGLSIREAERLLQKAALADGAVTAEDIPRMRTAKAELLTDKGVLELVEADVGTLDDVGGFENLKEWFRIRTTARSAEAAEIGLDPPRGVLLTGIPGCGKSMVAKTIARTWGLPLVLLDPGRLYSKFVGESEERLGSALAAMDAMAPVVLWIDEIEKGLAAADSGDGGVSRRLLGTFLRWMQDRASEVFLVATANDVQALPPELLRKGRFDEIFFVDLPDTEARADILSHHLERRSQNPLTSTSRDWQTRRRASRVPSWRRRSWERSIGRSRPRPSLRTSSFSASCQARFRCPFQEPRTCCGCGHGRSNVL